MGSLRPASPAEEHAATKAERPPGRGDQRRESAAANLQDSAEQAAESVKAAATDAPATVKDETASSAHDVQDQAQAARGTVTGSDQ